MTGPSGKAPAARSRTSAISAHFRRSQGEGLKPRTQEHEITDNVCKRSTDGIEASGLRALREPWFGTVGEAWHAMPVTGLQRLQTGLEPLLVAVALRQMPDAGALVMCLVRGRSREAARARLEDAAALAGIPVPGRDGDAAAAAA